jgi:hypothetical protein
MVRNNRIVLAALAAINVANGAIPPGAVDRHAYLDCGRRIGSEKS